MFSSWTRHWSLASTYSATHLWCFWNSISSEHTAFRAQEMPSVKSIPGPASLVHSRDAICNAQRLVSRSEKKKRKKNVKACNYAGHSSWCIEIRDGLRSLLAYGCLKWHHLIALYQNYGLFPMIDSRVELPNHNIMPYRKVVGITKLPSWIPASHPQHPLSPLLREEERKERGKLACGCQLGNFAIPNQSWHTIVWYYLLLQYLWIWVDYILHSCTYWST